MVGLRSARPAVALRMARAPRDEESKEAPMAADDKIDNKTDQVKGKAKETLGKATDDDELEAKGKKDQAKGDVKQAGEKLKDAVKGD